MLLVACVLVMYQVLEEVWLDLERANQIAGFHTNNKQKIGVPSAVVFLLLLPYLVCPIGWMSS